MKQGRARLLAVAALGGLFLIAGAAALNRRRALRAFEQGVAAYYAEDWGGAEQSLRRSLSARRDRAVAAFLGGLLVERARLRMRDGDPVGAAELLRQAARLVPEDKGLDRAAQALAVSGGIPSAEELLDRLADSESERGSRPVPAPDAGSASALRELAAAQSRLERAFAAALAAAAVLLAAFLAAGAWLLWTLFGPRGAVARLLELQRQAGALPAEGRRLLAASAGREIEAIEAEFTLVRDQPIAGDLLKPYLEDPEPWVRARAALALLKRGADEGRSILEGLLSSSEKGLRTAALSALGSSPSAVSLELVEPLLEDADREVQAAAIRALASLKADPGLDDASRARASALLDRVRRGWII